MKINGFVLAVAKDGGVNRIPIVGNAERLDEELVIPKKEKTGRPKKEKTVRSKKEKTVRPKKKSPQEHFSHVVHTFEPVYDSDSRILILGTFPSVKSRENQFYYGHPQNRLWKVLSALTEEPVPVTTEEKKKLLLDHKIAIWDVVQACDIRGSSDSSIRNVVPTDIGYLLRETKISRIYANGDTAWRLYRKYCYKDTGVEIIKLPSTSPANAIFSLERLTESWKEAIRL